jgi:tetratricopeptide (TPR) repeat protein
VRNPNDGEAWGRLAKAYKESIRQRRGFRSDEVGMELYRLSDQAYQQALALLPRDADWHFGYADLLCWNAEWNRFFTMENEALQACAAQVKQTLEINPKHEAANALLQYLAQFENPKVVSFNGEAVVYLILTPIPTAMATHPLPTVPIQPTPSPTPPRLTPSAQPTKTSALPTSPNAVRVTPTVLPTDQNAIAENNYLVTLLIVVIVVSGSIIAIRAFRSRK